MQTSGRLEELEAQLASVCDRLVKNDEDCRQQMLQIEQEQEKNRQEIEKLSASKRQQKMERDNEYPQQKRNLEAKITAERDAEVSNLLDEYNEKFGRELAAMNSDISNEIARDEELVRIAYETFNAGSEMARAQSQAIQATRYCQKTHEDNELLLLRQEIQVEREKQQRREEVEERRRKIEEKKQEIEKMIQETEEEEEILRRLQEEKLGDKGDPTILEQGKQSIGADQTLSKAVESFQARQAGEFQQTVDACNRQLIARRCSTDSLYNRCTNTGWGTKPTSNDRGSSTSSGEGTQCKHRHQRPHRHRRRVRSAICKQGKAPLGLE